MKSQPLFSCHDLKPPIYLFQVPEAITKVPRFFLPEVPCLLTFGSSEATTIAQWAQ